MTQLCFSHLRKSNQYHEEQKATSSRSKLRAEQHDSRLNSDVCFFFFLSIQLITMQRVTVRGLDA